MASSIRTFIAIPVSEKISVHAGRLVKRFERTGVDVKWGNVADMHLTLKFMGNLPTEAIADICRALIPEISSFKRFSIRCQGAGAFPNVVRPRTLWLGFDQGREQLIELQDIVERALEELGYRRESRQFHPHLTLGRVRAGNSTEQNSALSEMIGKHTEFDAGQMSVDEVFVFASELSRQGPSYSTLGRIELAKR